MADIRIDGSQRDEILKKLTRMQNSGESWVVIDLMPDIPVNLHSLSFWADKTEAREICDLSKHQSECRSIDDLRQYLLKNTNVMIQKNVSYLADQVKYAGFGEKHEEAIKKQIGQKPETFQLKHDAEINGQPVQAILDFSKSKQSEMYFFNRYTVSLTPENGKQQMSQQFLIPHKGQHMNLKEAYNLMNGRAVFKEKMSNKEGELYAAWFKLNFKESDNHQGFKLKPYGENYGFKLEEALNKQPIMELIGDADKAKLIASLEKGNRVAATFNEDGKISPRFIEASPTSRGLNMYDSEQKLIKQAWQPREDQANTQKNEQAEKTKQGKKQGQAA